MIENAVVHSASRSILFGKRWVFSFVLNDDKDCECRPESGNEVFCITSKQSITVIQT